MLFLINKIRCWVNRFIIKLLFNWSAVRKTHNEFALLSSRAWAVRQSSLPLLGEYTLQELLINKADLRAILQARNEVTPPQTEDVLHPGYESRSQPAARGTGEAPPE